MIPITVTVPATSANLGPGFDCLGLALGLRNRVTLLPRPEGLQVTVLGEGAGSIPEDSSNLVCRAARRLFQQAGPVATAWLSLPFHFILENHIPAGSGLGSSAAAIVGGLVAANACLEEPLPTGQVLALAVAMEGHPDNVTPALLGGLTLTLDAGGQPRATRLPVAPMAALVVLPEFELPTAQARAVLPASVPLNDAVFNAGRAVLLVQALQTGHLEQLRLAMDDRLHQPYRLPLVPGMAEAVAVARLQGAAVALSGAGPGLILFTPGNHEVIARQMEAAFAAAGLRCRHWLLPVETRGATWQRQEPDGRRVYEQAGGK